MKRNDLILHGMNATFDEERWFAPLKDAIEGTTAGQANWRPSGVATKSIWENVNHLIYYKERLVANLEGREWTNNLDGDATFDHTKQSNDDAEWNQVMERALNVNQRLRELLSQITDEELKQDSFGQKLLDIFLHEAYHTGQIIQNRKLQGSWPSHR